MQTPYEFARNRPENFREMRQTYTDCTDANVCDCKRLKNVREMRQTCTDCTDSNVSDRKRLRVDFFLLFGNFTKYWLRFNGERHEPMMTSVKNFRTSKV